MDPEATLAILHDEDATTDERDMAALDLLVWMARGGAMSLHREGLRPQADTIDDCQSRLLSVIEGDYTR